MGPYLSKPQTKLFSSVGENDKYLYCTAEMQGWRKSQEDAHVALLNYDDKGSAFFAVFDGHGGEEISKYCSIHLPNFIRGSDYYRKDNIVLALEDSFLKFDQTLKNPEVISELKNLACINEEEEEIDLNETTNLKKEASMSIEEVITKNFKYYYDTVRDDDEERQNGKEGDDGDEGNNGETEKIEKESDKDEPTSSSSGLKKKNHQHLLKSETLKAFLNDFIHDDDDDDDEEEDEEEEESDEENGEMDESSSNDEEEEEESGEENEEDDGLKNIREYNEPGRGSGCTAIVALIRDRKLYVANVGDSRCVLSREGKAVEMSEDHKPEDEREIQRIINAGGEVTPDGRVNGGLNLSRAIGDHLYKNNTNLSDREQMITALPDVRTLDIDPEKDDFLFLACDGIWNSMNSQEVVTFINERLRKNLELKTICDELFKVCLAPNTEGDGSGCDNMTCILVKFKNLKIDDNDNNEGKDKSNNNNGNEANTSKYSEDNNMDNNDINTKSIDNSTTNIANIQEENVAATASNNNSNNNNLKRSLDEMAASNIPSSSKDDIESQHSEDHQQSSSASSSSTSSTSLSNNKKIKTSDEIPDSAADATASTSISNSGDDADLFKPGPSKS